MNAYVTGGGGVDMSSPMCTIPRNHPQQGQASDPCTTKQADKDASSLQYVVVLNAEEAAASPPSAALNWGDREKPSPASPSLRPLFLFIY